MNMTLAAKQRGELSRRCGRPVGKPLASVIIPTHNRRELLEMVLKHIARQTVDLSSIEVIVVADGCNDGTLEMLGGCRWPFPVQILQHSQQNSGASRNAGAAIAQAPVLVFLDDDIMAAPDLIERHLAAHRDGLPTAAIGRLAPASMRGVPGWERWLEGQLEKQYRAMQQGRRRIGGLRLYSGNCSVSRDAFLEVGGFNEQLSLSEDVELGLRLEKAGVAFRLALDASGEHWGYRDYSSWRNMAYGYGRWDADLVFKREFPFALERLRDEYTRHGRIRHWFVSSALKGEAQMRLLVAAFRVLAIASGLVRISLLERRAYAAIYELTYWQGVSDELGGLRAVAVSLAAGRASWR
jgi:GT2 family glycosyltransferase